MRIARKLVLLCAMALAALALGASTASADTPITVVDEGTGNPCGNCDVQAHGESHLNLFGVRVSTCEDTFEASIGASGLGHIFYNNIDHDTGVCTRIACNGVGEAPTESEFDIVNAEETAPGIGEMAVDFCLDEEDSPNSTGTHCTANVLVEDLGGHDYQFSMHDQCLGGLIEVEGVWTTTTGTGHDQIEIVHN